MMIAVHTAWFFVFCLSWGCNLAFCGNFKLRKNQVEHLKKEAFQQIEDNMEQLLILNDQIRNPLQAILLDASVLDENTNVLISDQVKTIEVILDHLDDRYWNRKRSGNFYGNITILRKNKVHVDVVMHAGKERFPSAGLVIHLASQKPEIKTTPDHRQKGRTGKEHREPYRTSKDYLELVLYQFIHMRRTPVACSFPALTYIFPRWPV